jgi:phage-related protein
VDSDKGWKIQLYESLRGDQPVEEFIKSLDEKAQNKIARTFDHVEEFGGALGQPHMKKLTGTNLWELRILGSDSVRIFYITMTGKIFLLLHGFKKKAQKTPRKEIIIAEKRLDEFRSRKHH